MTILQKEFLVHEIKGLLEMLELEAEDAKFQISSVDTNQMILKRTERMRNIINRIEEKIEI